MIGRPGLCAAAAAACGILLASGAPGTPGTPATPDASSPDAAPLIASAAQAWLAALDPARRLQAALPFASEERFNWGYVPRQRRGVAIRDMTLKERGAARALLKSSLSTKGLTKVDAIVRLEEVLFALQRSAVRNPELYNLTVFGTPAPQGDWGWRFEGHHLSLNWTIREGRLVSSTPQFLGANPAFRTDPLHGARPLKEEQDLGRALMWYLSPEQRARAIIPGEPPADILTGNSRSAARLPEAGIAAAEMTTEQQAILLALIEEYLSTQPEATARARLESIRTSLSSVRFAWQGGLLDGLGHYYRIQGSTFLIEYDNTQDGANHIHSVWREFEGDWGQDPLAEHYATAPHHAAARRAAKEIR